MNKKENDLNNIKVNKSALYSEDIVNFREIFKLIIDVGYEYSLTLREYDDLGIHDNRIGINRNYSTLDSARKINEVNRLNNEFYKFYIKKWKELDDKEIGALVYFIKLIKDEIGFSLMNKFISNEDMMNFFIEVLIDDKNNNKNKKDDLTFMLLDEDVNNNMKIFFEMLNKNNKLDTVLIRTIVNKIEILINSNDVVNLDVNKLNKLNNLKDYLQEFIDIKNGKNNYEEINSHTNQTKLLFFLNNQSAFANLSTKYVNEMIEKSNVNFIDNKGFNALDSLLKYDFTILSENNILTIIQNTNSENYVNKILNSNLKLSPTIVSSIIEKHINQKENYNLDVLLNNHNKLDDQQLEKLLLNSNTKIFLNENNSVFFNRIMKNNKLFNHLKDNNLLTINSEKIIKPYFLNMKSEDILKISTNEIASKTLKFKEKIFELRDVYNFEKIQTDSNLEYINVSIFDLFGKLINKKVSMQEKIIIEKIDLSKDLIAKDYSKTIKEIIFINPVNFNKEIVNKLFSVILEDNNIDNLKNKNINTEILNHIFKNADMSYLQEGSFKKILNKLLNNSDIMEKDIDNSFLLHNLMNVKKPMLDILIDNIYPENLRNIFLNSNLQEKNSKGESIIDLIAKSEIIINKKLFKEILEKIDLEKCKEETIDLLTNLQNKYFRIENLERRIRGLRDFAISPNSDKDDRLKII